VRIKICGITRLEDGEAALHAGADALGLVLAPGPRWLDLDRATALGRALPPLTLWVAVVRNPSAAELEAIHLRMMPPVVQFHGEEDVATCRSIGRPFLKAFQLESEEDLEGIESFRSHCPEAMIMVDAGNPGSGRRCRWDLAAVLARRFPLVLAGGLDPENVAAAVREVMPAGLDVSSGVESAPGIKCPDRLAAFMARARAAGRESGRPVP
jgi:phosphoribosylanthranilate isomerase